MNPSQPLNPQSGLSKFLNLVISKKHACVYAIFLCFVVSPYHAVAQRTIAQENALVGNLPADWDVAGGGDNSIQGFSTELSVNKGSTIFFKIKTDASNYTIDIYRIGYYNGRGARRWGSATITATLPQTQPQDEYDPSTGKTDCSNWLISANWSVPTDAVSGVYIAKLKRSNNGGSSHIIFIVRDDASSANILYKTSDATWQAYNNYGGNSLYAFTNYNNVQPIPVAGYQQAVKLSYNRPIMTRAGVVGSGVPESYFFNAEYAMLRWLERNGYNMSYTTQIDIAKRNTAITPTNYNVLLSIGHDEYWSAEERKIYENARNAGVNLAFFSANEVSWKIRWEDNFRTMVCYKEGGAGEYSCPGKCDPLQTVWTGLWVSGCQFPLADGCNPGNSLTGQYGSATPLSTSFITVPAVHKELRFWRNTQIAALQAGQSINLTDGSLGYEWDKEQFSAPYPVGRVALSNTVLDGERHKMSLYRQPNGALVFGAGTIYWAWGLDGVHDIKLTTEDRNMQQATVNLLADMGAQPQSLQSNLVPAVQIIDVEPPVSVVTTNNSSIVNKTKAFNIMGTANDPGGVVAGVEISFDGGNTWKLADGTKNWSYFWTSTIEGSVNIVTRAFDDFGNIEDVTTSPQNKISLVVVPNICPCTVFSQSDIADVARNDGKVIEVGMKFKSTVDGFVVGIRYYKSAGNGGTVVGHLWKTTGTITGDLLAEVTFQNETISGWQQVVFSQPVLITAGQTYVVSTYNSNGDYSFSRPYFINEKNSSPLIALADGPDGGNGVYNYPSSTTPVYPANTYIQSNYWVDVVFNIKGPLISLQPVPVSVCAGTQATFITSLVSGSQATVQWYKSINGGVLYTYIPFATSDTLSISANFADNGTLYRAVWTNIDGSVTTTAAALTVYPPIVPDLTVNNGCTASTGTITVTATGGVAPFTYSVNGGQFQTSNVFSNFAAGNYAVTLKDAKGCTAVANTFIAQVNPLTITTSSTTASSGNNGTATVVATNGTSPYTYLWSNGLTANTITNLSAGQYTVTVTDGIGCTATASTVVINTKALVISLQPVPVSVCAGTQATFITSAVSGSQATVQWYKSINGGVLYTYIPFATSGTLSIPTGFADNGTLYRGVWTNIDGSVTTTAAALTVYPSIVPNLTVNNGCTALTGTITVTATGGVAPLTYSVNGGQFQTGNVFSNLAAGTYNIIVSDSKGCSALATTTILPPVALTATTSSTPVSNATNNNGTASVSALGGTQPYTYLWNNGNISQSISGLIAGTYSVVVTDSKGCIANASASVVVTLSCTTPVAIIIPSNINDFCADLTLTANTTTLGNVTYEWKLGSAVVSTSRILTLKDASATGKYTVTVSAGTGCASLPVSYTYNKQNTLQSYTILSLNYVGLGRYNNVLKGSVGNTKIGGEVAFDANGSLLSTGAFVKASKITINSPSNIPTRITSNVTVSLPTFLKNTSSTSGLANVTISSGGNTTISGNRNDVIIGSNATVVVTGSVFGRFQINSGAKVTFTSSDISLRELTTSDNVVVTFTKNALVKILGRMTLGKNVRVNPTGYNVIFYDENNVAIDESTVFIGSIYAPNDDINIKGPQNYNRLSSTSGTFMTGRFIASNIKSINDGVIWNSFDCISATSARSAVPKPSVVTTDTTSTTKANFKVKISPNPFISAFSLNIQSADASTPVLFRVLDVTGKEIMTQKAASNTNVVINAAKWAPGVYLAEVWQGGNRNVVKIVKSK